MTDGGMRTRDGSDVKYEKIVSDFKALAGKLEDHSNNAFRAAAKETGFPINKFRGGFTSVQGVIGDGRMPIDYSPRLTEGTFRVHVPVHPKDFEKFVIVPGQPEYTREWTVFREAVEAHGLHFLGYDRAPDHVVKLTFEGKWSDLESRTLLRPLPTMPEGSVPVKARAEA